MLRPSPAAARPSTSSAPPALAASAAAAAAAPAACRGAAAAARPPARRRSAAAAPAPALRRDAAPPLQHHQHHQQRGRMGDAAAGAAAPHGGQRAHHRRTSAGSSRVCSLPEDGHHSPRGAETPEAWLLAKREHDAAAAAKAAPGGGRRLRVPVVNLEVTPELVAISMVYFVQGILGLSRLALSFFFKDDLGVEPAQVAVLTGLAGLPWVVKPLYGFISDAVPLWGYRRRSYLVLCGLAGSVSWLALALAVRSPGGAVAAMLLGSLSTACSDVVVDSLVVERARGEPASTAGSLQSLCWASSAVGGIASAYFSGSLVEQYGSYAVFAITAVFPLVVSASAVLIDERRAAPGGGGAALPPPPASPASPPPSPSGSAALRGRVLAQASALWGAVRERRILLPALFVFLWQATPSADTAMFYFYTNRLEFTPEFLGRVRLAGAVASLAGVALYNGCFKAVPLKRMLLGAMVLGTALGSTQLLLVSGANRVLGLSDELFVLGDSVVLTVLGQVSFMPILVLAARLCPEGVEATLFATLMSISNGGSFVGSASGAALTGLLGVTSTNFANMYTLVLLCTLSTLLPAPFLWLLPASLDEPGDDEEGGGGGAVEVEVAVLRGGGEAGAAAPAGPFEASGDGSEAAPLLGGRGGSS